MKKRPYEGLLFASDLDGTLLDDTGRISEKNRRAIAEYTAGGGWFTVATGRTIASTRRIIDGLGVNAPVIVMNGSGIYDFGREALVWYFAMPGEARGHVQAVMDALPDVGVEISCGTELYVVRSNACTEWHMAYEKMRFTRVHSLDEVPPRWNKVLFEQVPERLHEVEEFCAARSASEVLFARSSPIFLEIIPRHAHKGSTLQVLAGLLEIKLDKTAAMGDYYNDRLFIPAGGTGFVPSNAPAEIAALADHVVCSNNDGAVAEALAIWRRLAEEGPTLSGRKSGTGE